MSGSFINGGDGGTAGTHDWLTPPELLSALGEFDIDPCASQFQPWRTAATQYTIEDDGLAREWVGRVWCNPPYGPHAEKFLKRMAAHGNGIALIFARTETRSFQEHCWRKADGMLFMAGHQVQAAGRREFWPGWRAVGFYCLWPAQRRDFARQRNCWLFCSACKFRGRIWANRIAGGGVTPLQADTKHLSWLALSPHAAGWCDQIAHQIDALESCKSGLWRGLRDEVNAAVRAAKNQKGELK